MANAVDEGGQLLSRVHLDGRRIGVLHGLSLLEI
jgi:hypothetical protein